jgi:uncharacterized protein (TIGR03067 family)
VVPAALAEAAVQAGLRFAVYQPVAAGVATLADGFLKSLLRARWTRVAALVSALVVMIGVVCLLWFRPWNAGQRGAPAGPLAAVQAERQKLQGTWRMDVPVPKDAQGMLGQAIQEVRYIFRGSQWGMTVGGPQFQPMMQSFAIDPSQEPKAIDLTTPDGKVIHGIYRLDGETLTLCLDYDPQNTGRPRPTTFGAQPGVTLAVLRHEPAKPASP